MPGVALTVSLLLAAATPKIVMPDWVVVDVTPELARFYADHLAKGLRQEGVSVITAEEIKTVLRIERQRELLGCAADATDCMAELGNALGADGTLVVSLAKLEQTFTANLKVLSSTSGAVLAETSVEAQSQRALLSELSDAAALLGHDLQNLRPAGVVTATTSSTATVRRRAVIPAVAAAVLAVAGGISAGFAQLRFDGLRNEPTYSRANALASEGFGWQVSTWVGFSLAGACVVAAVIMFIARGGS